MSDDYLIRTTIRARFLYPAKMGAMSLDTDFQWESWSKDLRHYAENAKQGIEQAEDHDERLNAYHLYVTRLAAMLEKLPNMKDAMQPLRNLKREVDLLVHHQKSDLLKPVAASRSTPTNADQTFRMVSVLAYRLHRQVGCDEKQARIAVARLVQARGYSGSRGAFGAAELKNWISKVENGEYPMARKAVETMMTALPSIASAFSLPEATGLSKQMLECTPLPPLSKAQADKTRAIE